MKKVSKKRDGKPVKILQIGMHDKIGGVETFLMNYYQNIDRDKYEISFINMYEQLCFSNEIKKNDGKIYNVCNVKRNPIKYYFELKKILTENKFDIVHINLLSLANILPILASKKANIKNIVLHSHNASTPKGIIRKILNKINRVFAIKNSTHLFACSKLAGEWMFGKNKKITIINNAVNFEKFSYNSNIREKIRKELKIEEKFVIGHIGRFSEQKNHTFLIDIFKKVAEKNDNAILHLIGE